MTRASRKMGKYRRKQTRRTRRRRVQPQRRRRLARVYMRGGNLPIPAGAVAGVRLDPTDEYSAPVLVRKEEFEEEVLDRD